MAEREDGERRLATRLEEDRGRWLAEASEDATQRIEAARAEAKALAEQEKATHVKA